MAETDENGDWRGLMASPRGLFSAFISDGFASRSSLNGTDAAPASADGEPVSSERKAEDAGGAAGRSIGSGVNALTEVSSVWKPEGVRNGASIAERRAAICGFSAPRINTARFRSVSPLSSPGVCSPYLTIPPGLSPTTLLDSPVMLPNSQACSPNQTQNLEKSGSNHQGHARVQQQVDFECQTGFPKPAMLADCTTNLHSDAEVSNNMIVDNKFIALQTCHSGVASDQAPLIEEPVHGEDNGSQQQLLEGDQKGSYASLGLGRPSEDGYNWRKYGQKQVKGSEFPRSYYKCTHQNCQVKKKVERSLDGQITEIIYKGAHNHPKPQPNRRSAIGSALPFNDMPETDWRADGLERTSSTSVLTELSDPLSTAQGKHVSMVDSADTPELSSTLASHEDDEDRATQGSISVGDDGDDDESESKRRKKESCLIETSLASRAVREPRVVVQTTSEVDILDDGYRWRKYGQKVVKGNPNPRSYYKCTSAGCSVRKHVERASHDLKSVITTYEGKHNHEVPAARNSSHVNPGAGNIPPAGPNVQTALTLPGSTNFPKPEPQIQDLAPRFERKPDFGNEFLRTGYLGGFSSDIKLGTSCYELKLPPLQTAMPFGSFGLNPSHGDAHQMASIAQLPEFPMSLPLSSLPRPANLGLTGYDFSGKTIGPTQSLLGVQPPKETDTRFLRPKQEQKDDAAYDTHAPINHLGNASSSIYRQMMGSYPL
ncbi:PREDICTED: probable WRKY transcription factor 34 isoform X2 [Nelumbo nucifera]|uniref:WRKY domain-containing protein n=2 Tax=Nelumbo nucifera TaxID=4432 RepID=A0A822XUP7_NELNU|nr:PREDICTED: probable WRKY transcription factor 34 isoform X2 [Nelumbo nucifera]DAD25354.1 TPA_asm: hypothetical protein HUJ06_026818 [Nelumbo nucifera]